MILSFNKKTVSRLQNEQEHGRWIAEHGEEVWNWSSPAGRLRWALRSLIITATRP